MQKNEIKLKSFWSLLVSVAVRPLNYFQRVTFFLGEAVNITRLNAGEKLEKHCVFLSTEKGETDESRQLLVRIIRNK